MLVICKMATSNFVVDYLLTRIAVKRRLTLLVFSHLGLDEHISASESPRVAAH